MKRQGLLPHYLTSCPFSFSSFRPYFMAPGSPAHNLSLLTPFPFLDHIETSYRAASSFLAAATASGDRFLTRI